MVTHFIISFSQYINFHKTSNHISQWILTVGKDNQTYRYIYVYKIYFLWPTSPFLGAFRFYLCKDY